jgi:hypothetical protein
MVDDKRHQLDLICALLGGLWVPVVSGGWYTGIHGARMFYGLFCHREIVGT